MAYFPQRTLTRLVCLETELIEGGKPIKNSSSLTENKPDNHSRHFTHLHFIQGTAAALATEVAGMILWEFWNAYSDVIVSSVLSYDSTIDVFDHRELNKLRISWD